MFFLTNIFNDSQRKFSLEDEILIFISDNVSTVYNLASKAALTYEDLKLTHSNNYKELLFLDEKGRLYNGYEMKKLPIDFTLSMFLAQSLALSHSFNNELRRGIYNLELEKQILDSAAFGPRYYNLIMSFKGNIINVITDGFGNNGAINMIHIFEIIENNTCTKPKYSFTFDFPNHASVGTRLNENTHIKRVLGIIHNKLYVSFTDNSLMIIDIEKGEVLKHLGYSDGGKRKRDPINHLVTADFLGGGNVDAGRRYLFNLWNSVMYYFDAESEKITQIDLTEELKDKNLDSAVIKYFDDDIIAILDLRAGGVGIIDRHTHKLLWHQTMYFEGKKVRPLELKISGNYMCITDSAEQLHIFERTTALK